jgi:hypothetical protein
MGGRNVDVVCCHECMGVYGCVWVCVRVSETEAEEREVGETKRFFFSKTKIDTYCHHHLFISCTDTNHRFSSVYTAVRARRVGINQLVGIYQLVYLEGKVNFWNQSISMGMNQLVYLSETGRHRKSELVGIYKRIYFVHLKQN